MTAGAEAKRRDLVTVALHGQQGKPRPALVIQAAPWHCGSPRSSELSSATGRCGKRSSTTPRYWKRCAVRVHPRRRCASWGRWSSAGIQSPCGLTTRSTGGPEDALPVSVRRLWGRAGWGDRSAWNRVRRCGNCWL